MPPFTSADPDSYLALGIQTAQGTPQVTAAKVRYAHYIAGNEFNVDQEVTHIREGGGGLDLFSSYKSKVAGRGQLVHLLRPEISGLGLAWSVGGATWDGGSSPAIHTFHSNHSSYPLSSLLTGHPGTDMANLYSDARSAGFTFEAAAGQPLKLMIPYVAITVGGSYAIPGVPTYYDDAYFMFYSTPSIQLDGSADGDVESMTITEALALDEIQTQDVDLAYLPVMNRELSVEVVKLYSDATLWEKVYYQGGVAPSHSVATGSLRGHWVLPGAPTQQFDIHAPLIAWESAAITALNPDGETVKITVSGKALPGATHSLIAQLTNTHASAYA